MSRGRAAGRRLSELGLPVVVALTGWVTMLSWRGFSRDSSAYLAPLAVGALLVAVTGIGLRRTRVPVAGVVAAQVVVAAAYLAVLLTGSPVPTGARWQELVDAFRGAVETSREFPSPVPAEAPGIHPLMILFGLLLLVAMDAVACTLRRVPLAGLPLLAAYALPTSLLVGGVPWVVFVLAAGGYLTMVVVDEDDRLYRWGRTLAAEGGLAQEVRSAGSRRGSTLGIGAAALALAVVVPTLVPTLQLGVFGLGAGPGDRDVSLVNPVTDLRRDLRRGVDVPLLTLTTDNPAPSYLRIAVLNRFTNNEWSSGNRDIPGDQVANGDMPPPPGVSQALVSGRYRYRVRVTSEFTSTWLPVMSPVSRVVAPGNWRYDVTTMDFIAADDDTNTAGLSYEMTGLELDVSQRLLDQAPNPTGSVDRLLTDLPPDLPSSVGLLAAQVTAGRTTKYQQAVALQRWFRSTGGFRYSLDRAPVGNGTDDLLAFLDPAEGRVGYCEQFASAMAVMARTRGIPARVAVGFLTPDRVGRDQWEYSAWDLHAWPELYFPGAGWVRFEPTPAGRGTVVPPYTQGRLPEVQQPSELPTSTASDELLTRGPSVAPNRDRTDPTSTPRTGLRLPWAVILGSVGAVLLLGLLLSVPALLRRGRRRRRWARSRGPEAAWAELRDTMVDLGHHWPTGRSPRDAARVIAGRFGVPVSEGSRERPPHGPEQNRPAVAALDRIVESLERARYSRHGSGAGLDLRADTETCAEALVGGTAAPARRRARWWPRSVFRPTPSLEQVEAELELVGGPGHPERVVDHVG